MKHKATRKWPVRSAKAKDLRKQLAALERGQVPINLNAPVRMVLVFPNHYRVGMASVGFQTVFHLLNQHPGVRCERAFAQGVDNRDIRTFETNTPIRQCDVVAFTLAFELDIPNVLELLIQSDIPLLRDERSPQDPVILTGGVVASLNPSPLLPFMDGLLVGEGEGLFLKLCDLLYQNKISKESRQTLLQNISELPGFFVPGISQTVSRQVLESLEGTEAYTPIVTPKSHFKNMFVVEVGRGCRRGCFFCAAQHVYDPFRIRSHESILETIQVHNPGSNRIGLESAGLSDYPDLHLLIDKLVQKDYSVSFSSIRADRVTPELLEQIEQSGAQSFAVAPETGNQALRIRIGKGISQERLLNTARLVAQSSIRILKLYFLIGLPSETMDDVFSINDCIEEISNCFRLTDKKKMIRVSVNAFIPKPFTEFQWAAMENAELLKKKRAIIEQSVKKMKNVTLSVKSTRLEQLQGALALGGQDIGLALMKHLQTKCSWKQALNETGVDLESLLWRSKEQVKIFPWHIIQDETNIDDLWKRYQALMNAAVVSNRL